MTPQQRVGQLFVLGVMSTGATEEQLRQLQQDSAGNAFLRGPTDLSVEDTRAVSDAIAEVTTYAGVRPFVSADQESANAQSLDGDGFSAMPDGLEQGELRPARLRREAKTWGEELKAAGVTLDLAPVADVVPTDVGTDNDPIGYFERQLGSEPTPVGRHAAAFVRGMADAGVATSVKHFPGIGRASGNTDSDPQVSDPTTRNDPLLGSFEGALAGDPAMVMVSSGFYPKISDGPRACFNPTIIKGMLRGDLGYDGVIVSDSFGSASVAGDPPGKRALRFFRAGGTLLLDTNSDDLRPMARAVLRETQDDPAFAKTTKANVLRVLEAKERFGLIG
ncbi:beta-N-acetylhexosaminidase [Marmoricola endophyticus]|uniref:beta-N-acetylhexosaminidase n=2 Tax=Marmoricola endophyticus TaxID=2040280 RepID=A0A917BJE9_9ACTN|nr:beta-N-acetylhexosaminidase [Marmoricola endophyticus]